MDTNMLMNACFTYLRSSSLQRESIVCVATAPFFSTARSVAMGEVLEQAFSCNFAVQEWIKLTLTGKTEDFIDYSNVVQKRFLSFINEYEWATPEDYPLYKLIGAITLIHDRNKFVWKNNVEPSSSFLNAAWDKNLSSLLARKHRLKA